MKKHTMRAGIFALVLLLSACVSVRVGDDKLASSKGNQHNLGASEVRPSNIDDICEIFAERPHWYRAARITEEATGAPIPMMMSIIYQESSFNGVARPRDKDTGLPISTAYGFPQALDSTWTYYQEKTGRSWARRDRFADAILFVGWYAVMTSKINGVPSHRADEIYLNYHEGWGGFERQTHLRSEKRWLLDTAAQVQRRSEHFRIQLSGCQASLNQSMGAPIGVVREPEIRRSINESTPQDPPPPNPTYKPNSNTHQF